MFRVFGAQKVIAHSLQLDSPLGTVHVERKRLH